MPDLHLIRLAVDPAGIERLAAARRFGEEDDLGYRLHALFSGLFGEAAPKPWCVDSKAAGRSLTVWAYASQPWSDLAACISTRFADPVAVGLDEDLVSLLRGALASERCESKVMPTLQANTQVAFDLRACATIRLHRDLPAIPAINEHGAVVARKSGDEVDVVVAEALRRSQSEGKPVHPGDVDRVATYKTWLLAAMARASGMTVEEVHLTGFRAVAVLRRHHQDNGRRSVRLPEIHATGVMRLTDPTAFGITLARGIGRHRAFGFGMLLLRPVG